LTQKHIAWVTFDFIAVFNYCLHHVCTWRFDNHVWALASEVHGTLQCVLTYIFCNRTMACTPDCCNLISQPHIRGCHCSCNKACKSTYCCKLI
jgi:hypothetical protein